jgi:hypothetical protein
MGGAVPPLPNTLLWLGAQLRKAQGQRYLYLDRSFFGLTRDHKKDKYFL